METKKKEFIDLLNSFRSYYGTYQHRKETMAWVSTVLFITACSVLLLKTGILEELYRDLSNFLIVSVFFTLAFCLFFCFIFWQFRRRELADTTVTASTNIISMILDNEQIKLDLKKGEFHGTLWPKALIKEYRRVEEKRRTIGSEVVSYGIVLAFYIGVLVKIMLAFYR
jgi:hypothetical protein